ncbi:MAG: thioredoxin domain-containing protein [Minicystis sp.]
MKRRIIALAVASLFVTIASACGHVTDESRGTEGEARRAPAAVTAPSTAAAVHRVPIDGAPARGEARAAVTLVAFTDYQCPFCRRAEGTVAELQKIYGAKLRVVMRHDPMPFHANGRAAAIAAAAAAEQGGFWAVHDRLFGEKRSLDEADLQRAAKEAGLDVTRWERARATAGAVVDGDIALAKSLGVEGTPSFFINGRILRGAQPVGAFRAVIDEEIAKAAALVKRGVRPEDVYATIMKDAVTAKVDAEAQAAPCDAPGGDCGCKGEAHEEESAPAKIEDVRVGDAPVRGSDRAPVTIVAYSDFECPFCARAEATLRALEQKYPGRVRVAFKSQPLPFHEHARLAARAALAAGEQGKFWEYHDVLFAHQDALDRAALERYAQDLRLDLARFRAALDDARTAAAVDADVAEATRLGVAGTPTFFVNGRRIIGAQPLEKFAAAVDAALAERR